MRLFVAVDLPDDVRRDLAGVIDELRPSALDAKWVPPENVHLTLVFLGEVAEERVEEIGRSLRGAVAGLAPVSTAVATTGAFPRPKRARVLWVGLEDAGGALAALAEACMDAMERLGFAREARAWTPHLTLARFRTPADVSGFPAISLRPARFEVREVALFRSRLARPAPRYEAVLRAPLAGPASGSARPAGT